MKTLYENLGGTYHEENEHLIPNVTLPEQTYYQIGKYGWMHLDYIKNQPSRKVHHALDRRQAKRSVARDRP